MQVSVENPYSYEAQKLSSELAATRTELAEARFAIRQLEAELKWLRQERYRGVSERLTNHQGMLFKDEEVPEDAIDRAEDAPSRSPRQKKKDRKKRSIIPEDCLRIVREVDLPEGEKFCVEHQCLLEKTGEKKIERLHYTPPSVHVEVDVCAVYNCSVCAKKESAKTAKPEDPEVIPGSAASASLLSHIAVSKFCDSLPLHRQEGILARSGIEITRTTMATWMIRTAELLVPLYNLILDHLKGAQYRGIDETPIQVHGIEGKKNTSTSFMWVMVGADDEKKAVFYWFDPTRSSTVARTLLRDCEGYVHTDGYKVYGRVSEDLGLRRIGCLMHIRRRFHKAYEVSKAEKTGSEVSGKALSLIRQIYEVEADIKGLSPPERKALRDQKTRPLLEALKDHVDTYRPLLPKSSKTGDALKYCSDEWDFFVRFMEDGRLEVDNGEVERRIKHFAVGRNNWNFFDSREGAVASSIIYTVLETAKANGVEPYCYLTEVLRRMPRAETLSDIEALLPWDLQVDKSPN